VRRLGWVAVAGTSALLILLGVALAPDEGETLAVGADWETFVFAVLDGFVAVAFTLWFVAWFQRRWTNRSALMDKAGRASYATYVVHPLVLTAVMLLFAGVPLPAEVKFVVVAAAAVPACFAAGYGLTRLPGVSRVL
jgi:peptidoglycan/LPS O-acetylase OafA/YrhL